jgi:hypothetical protein
VNENLNQTNGTLMTSEKDNANPNSSEFSKKSASIIDMNENEIKDSRRRRLPTILNFHRKGSIAVLRSRIEPFLVQVKNESITSPPTNDDEAFYFATIISSLELAILKLDYKDIDMAGSYWHRARRLYFALSILKESKEDHKAKDDHKPIPEPNIQAEAVASPPIPLTPSGPSAPPLTTGTIPAGTIPPAPEATSPALLPVVPIIIIGCPIGSSCPYQSSTDISVIKTKISPTSDKPAKTKSQATLERQANILLIDGRATLNDCEKQKVEALLLDKAKEKLKDDLSTADIVNAMLILDKHEEYVYFGINSVIVQLIVLSIFSLIASALLVILLGTVSFSASLTDIGFVFVLVLLGSLGGAVSCIKSFSDVKLAGDPNLPVQTISAWLTMIRPLVGAISALALAAFVLSGLVSFGTISPYQLMVVCFVAGFSERFLLGAVATIDKTK